ncbi:tetratricopeptide repeat protein [Marivita sp. S0852]|uniref:tetratricopeptide repeat protein n=1 Tax=Marivita sp. S0852 TaxID=3373893 RepID=UPI00398238FF
MNTEERAALDGAVQSLIDADIAGTLGLERAEIHAGLRAADADLEAGRTAEAAKRFAALALFDPLDTGPQIGLTRVALAEGQFESAMNLAAGLVMRDPARAEGFLLLAMAATGMGEVDAAIEDYQSALDRAPEGSALADAARGGLAAAQARRAP